MNKPVLINSYKDFIKTFGSINESDGIELDIAESILDKLIDLVGSEEEVEQCAKEAFEELEQSANQEGFEFDAESTPEKLAIAALLVKLVEHGKLDPQDADNFLEEYV